MQILICTGVTTAVFKERKDKKGVTEEKYHTPPAASSGIIFERIDCTESQFFFLSFVLMILGNPYVELIGAGFSCGDVS